MAKYHGNDTSTLHCNHQSNHRSDWIIISIMFYILFVAEVVRDHFLLFTDSSSNILYQVDTKTQEFHTLYVSASLTSSPGSPVYDPEEQNVYWIEKNKHEIWSMNLVDVNPELFLDLGTSTYG